MFLAGGRAGWLGGRQVSRVLGKRKGMVGMEEVRVSVRSLVEFLLRQGDIDNRRAGAPEEAMLEGGRIHRMIQKRMGPDYHAEVTLRYVHPTGRYDLVVEGRADGIFEEDGVMAIDEIKGTYRDVARLKEPVLVHLAQARCYAYLYAKSQGLPRMKVRMTYCNLETEDIRYFYEEMDSEALEEWFLWLLEEYQRWSDHAWEWKKVRDASIDALGFPFPYRDGQKELASYVYQTIYHKRKLFLEAPTGVGKTISTVFPALKAMGKGMGEKLFYLTAKTITRTVAEETLALLRKQGLRFKSVILTAKEKICFLDQIECNPEHCPYAKGHYDRVNDAMYDFLTHEESFSREKVEEYARKHRVCPFELCLDMSLFADGVICDYNYLFAPHVYLRRFFGDSSEGNYLFLIDEAHNLLERGREMYSATLVKEDFLELKRQLSSLQQEADAGPRKGSRKKGKSLKLKDPQAATGTSGVRSLLVREHHAERIVRQLERCNREFLSLKRKCESCLVLEEADGLVQSLSWLHTVIDDYLDEQEEGKLEIRDRILDFYFELRHFLDIYELVDENYVKYAQLREDGAFLVKLFCMNPATNLKECMKRGRSSILFSATFLPIQYYKGLLGGEKEDYEVYAKSVFSPEKRAILVARDVTSKYTRRTEEEYYNIAHYIDEIVKNRHGNYMVFFPSYSFMRTVYEIYQDRFASPEKECLLQRDDMGEEEREAFLGCFQEASQDRMLIGFCVLGGIFSEGIDLKNDRLIGVVVVGTGIPQVCYERELLKEHFNRDDKEGFDYAYRYPGMNKVLQAAGRVIRTAQDVGIIALLDERFLQPAYLKMFPREWESFEAVTLETVSKRVARFWDSWL